MGLGVIIWVSILFVMIGLMGVVNPRLGFGAMLAVGAMFLLDRFLGAS